MSTLTTLTLYVSTAIAVVILVTSFALLLLINSLQTWARKRQGGV